MLVKLHWYIDTLLDLIHVALLGIPPAANNGTFGALYDLLKPDVVEKLPKGWIYGFCVLQ